MAGASRCCTARRSSGKIDYSAIDYRWNNAGLLDSATVDPGQVPKTDTRSWNLYLRDRIGLLDERLQLTFGAPRPLRLPLSSMPPSWTERHRARRLA
jgi:hypothetical protein